MRAVNLIPAEVRRGAGGPGGQSGGIVYAFLGALAGLLVMGVLYAVYDHQASDRKHQLIAVSSQAAAAQNQAAQLAPYVQFASLSQQRTQALAQLANSRFNWSGAMDQIARALPYGVTLNALTGGAPAAAGGAPPAAASPVAAVGAAAASGPTFSFTGCARSHSVVGTALTQLRLIPGAMNVSLASSSKESGTATTPHTGGSAPAPAAPGASGQPTVACPYVTFQGTVVFGTDAVVRVTPPNATGAAPVQVAAPPGGALGGATGPTGPSGAAGAATPTGGAATPTAGGTSSSQQPTGAARRANTAAAAGGTSK
ncbi:MAG: hypothetical protein ACR2ND_14905 [Solirubrobacteraceae bacterium]